MPAGLIIVAVDNCVVTIVAGILILGTCGYCAYCAVIVTDNCEC